MADKKARQTAILMGNEAIGRGLVEEGVHFVTSYPGTPSSEILPSVVKFAPESPRPPYAEWSVNEKVAVETALAATYTGKRAASAMKQVGLNVALDPVMSAAYIGVVGGYIIVVADDPGPHSSQTEQDTRLLAHFAKLPVFDPMDPAQARDLIGPAFELSERHQIPVILRPVLRVCHARQNLELRPPKDLERPASFPRDPFRWAAIPKQRLALHKALNAKLEAIGREISGDNRFNIWHNPPQGKGKANLGILASGAAAGLAKDALAQMGLKVEGGRIPFLQTVAPFPFPAGPVERLLDSCRRVLVLEETEPLLEMLSPRREMLLGRYSGHVPSAGEITPELMSGILARVLEENRLAVKKPRGALISIPDQPPMRRPNLCPGCPHRAAFWSMRTAFPDGIFPGDIGCYTLGMNQGAVDTCHDMGAGVTMAASLSRVHQLDGRDVPVVATIGDSTFYHSGVTGLMNAVYNGARFVLLILDNLTTGMTGMQPTPETGQTADGHPGGRVPLTELVRGCGVEHITEIDAYDITGLTKALRKSWRQAKKEEGGGVAVIIARHPCVAHRRDLAIPHPQPVIVIPGGKAVPPVFDTAKAKCADCGRCAQTCPKGAITREAEGRMVVDAKLCTGCRLCASVCPTGAMTLEPAGACVACGLCTTWFNCPALLPGPDGKMTIDSDWCVECGLCILVCRHGAIVKKTEAGDAL